MSMEVPAALDAVEHAYDRAALDALTAAADQVVVAGRVAPAQAPRVTGQLARARRTIEATPTDPTTLLVHLTVARTLVNEGWGPPALARCLSAVMAVYNDSCENGPYRVNRSSGRHSSRFDDGFGDELGR